MATREINCRSGHDELSQRRPLYSQVPDVEGRKTIFLLPGELKVSEAPAQITTILGSCVAVCLWDANIGIGGMNHFLLPAWKKGEGASTRFGDIATKLLLQKLSEFGCQRRHLTARLFGGAALFTSQDFYKASLGAKNVEAARIMIKDAGIPLITQDTGGSQGRKIIFNTDNGSAWSRHV